MPEEPWPFRMRLNAVNKNEKTQMTSAVGRLSVIEHVDKTMCDYDMLTYMKSTPYFRAPVDAWPPWFRSKVCKAGILNTKSVTKRDINIGLPVLRIRPTPQS